MLVSTLLVCSIALGGYGIAIAPTTVVRAILAVMLIAVFILLLMFTQPLGSVVVAPLTVLALGALVTGFMVGWA